VKKAEKMVEMTAAHLVESKAGYSVNMSADQ
jgi:hypothetical protein